MEHVFVEWIRFQFGVGCDSTVLGRNEMLYSSTGSGVNQHSLGLDGSTSNGRHDCVDSFECSSQRVHGGEVHFKYVNAFIECSRLLGPGEDLDLEVRIEKCFEDVRPECAGGLVKLSVICPELSLGWESYTGDCNRLDL